MSQQHTLYRFFDSENSLLYVGRTVAPARRWREHERGASWYDAVASVTREVYAYAEDVDQAERAAIAAESPLYNIALNGRTSSAQRPRPLKPAQQTDTLVARWEAIQIAPALVCEGDETICECSRCHDKREVEFENLRSKYAIHPSIASAIDQTERAYFAGAELYDWYYDLFDIELFGRIRLIEDSKSEPMPAYIEIGNSAATADCPFCCNYHQYVVIPGMPLDEPVDVPCSAGRIALVARDWHEVIELQYHWGERAARREEAAA